MSHQIPTLATRGHAPARHVAGGPIPYNPAPLVYRDTSGIHPNIGTAVVPDEIATKSMTEYLQDAVPQILGGIFKVYMTNTQATTPTTIRISANPQMFGDVPYDVEGEYGEGDHQVTLDAQVARFAKSAIISLPKLTETETAHLELQAITRRMMGGFILTVLEKAVTTMIRSRHNASMVYLAQFAGTREEAVRDQTDLARGALFACNLAPFSVHSVVTALSKHVEAASPRVSAVLVPHGFQSFPSNAPHLSAALDPVKSKGTKIPACNTIAGLPVVTLPPTSNLLKRSLIEFEHLSLFNPSLRSAPRFMYDRESGQWNQMNPQDAVNACPVWDKKGNPYSATNESFKAGDVPMFAFINGRELSTVNSVSDLRCGRSDWATVVNSNSEKFSPYPDQMRALRDWGSSDTSGMSYPVKLFLNYFKNTGRLDLENACKVAYKVYTESTDALEPNDGNFFIRRVTAFSDARDHDDFNDLPINTPFPCGMSSSIMLRHIIENASSHTKELFPGLREKAIDTFSAWNNIEPVLSDLIQNAGDFDPSDTFRFSSVFDALVLCGRTRMVMDDVDWVERATDDDIKSVIGYPKMTEGEFVKVFSDLGNGAPGRGEDVSSSAKQIEFLFGEKIVPTPLFHNSRTAKESHTRSIHISTGGGRLVTVRPHTHDAQWRIIDQRHVLRPEYDDLKRKLSADARCKLSSILPYFAFVPCALGTAILENSMEKRLAGACLFSSFTRHAIQGLVLRQIAVPFSISAVRTVCVQTQSIMVVGECGDVYLAERAATILPKTVDTVSAHLSGVAITKMRYLGFATAHDINITNIRGGGTNFMDIDPEQPKSARAQSLGDQTASGRSLTSIVLPLSLANANDLDVMKQPEMRFLMNVLLQQQKGGAVIPQPAFNADPNPALPTKSHLAPYRDGLDKPIVASRVAGQLALLSNATLHALPGNYEQTAFPDIPTGKKMTVSHPMMA